MNFYEEFGLSPSASTEEIAKAHKRLARLLHPDQLQDEDLRRLAECQMKRLNAIYAVLSDRQQRLQYDLGLAAGSEGAFPAPVSGSPAGAMRRFVTAAAVQRNAIWIVSGLACVAVICWYFAQNAGTGKMPSQQTAHAQPPATPSPENVPPAVQSSEPVHSEPREPALSDHQYQQLRRETAALRRALGEAESERDAALAHLTRLQRSLEEERQFASDAKPEPVQPSPPPAPTAASAPAVTAPAAASSRPPAGKVSGTWFFVPKTLDPAPKDVYPPEYIEVVIAEENGQIRGRYRGRYRVADRAISPEVLFQFQGKVNSPGRYPWTGRSGARGEVHLKLVSDDSLQVAWFASELGQQMGLGSGTAVLIRRRER